MNKVVSIIFIIIFSILVVLLTAVLIILLNKDININSFSFNMSTLYSDNLIDSKEFDYSKDIKVESKIGSIFIEKSDNDEIKIELYSEEAEEYKIEDEDDYIDVKLINKRNSINYMSKKDKVVIYIPKEYDNLITTKQTVGDTKVDSFEYLKLNVKNTTGDIKVDKLDELVANYRTGDIKINKANTINATLTTGDIKVGEVNNIKTKLITGDIKIQKVNECIKANSTTGDVKITKAYIEKDSYIKQKVGDTKIESLKNAYIEAKTNIGDTKVNNNDRKLDNVITITKNTGDIKVNY